MLIQRKQRFKQITSPGDCRPPEEKWNGLNQSHLLFSPQSDEIIQQECTIAHTLLSHPDTSRRENEAQGRNTPQFSVETYPTCFLHCRSAWIWKLCSVLGCHGRCPPLSMQFWSSRSSGVPGWRVGIDVVLQNTCVQCAEIDRSDIRRPDGEIQQLMQAYVCRHGLNKYDAVKTVNHRYARLNDFSLNKYARADLVCFRT